MAQECCRLCSESGGALINIFGDQGIKRNISEKINSRLHILVLMEDSLPKTICFSCYGKLDIFDSFVKNVHSVQGILTKQVSEVSEISRNSANTQKSNVIDTIEIHDEPKASKVPEITVTAKKRVLEKDESPVTKKAKVTKYAHQVSKITLHINDACSLSNPSSSSTSETPMTRNNASKYCSETAYVQHEIVDNLGKEINDSSVSSNTKTEPNDSENTIRNSGGKVIKIKNSVRKSETRKSVTPNQKKSKFKRKYFESQVTAETSIKRLPPVTSKTKPSPSTSSNVRLTKQIKTPKKNVSSAEKKDYTAQAGNTLYSDLKNLKNSLILKKVPITSAEVLAIIINPDVASKNFSNSKTDKGCQTDVRLVTKSKGKDAIIHQKTPFLDGKSPLDDSWEQISSPFKI